MNGIDKEKFAFEFIKCLSMGVAMVLFVTAITAWVTRHFVIAIVSSVPMVTAFAIWQGLYNGGQKDE